MNSIIGISIALTVLASSPLRAQQTDQPLVASAPVYQAGKLRHDRISKVLSSEAKKRVETASLSLLITLKDERQADPLAVAQESVSEGFANITADQSSLLVLDVLVHAAEMTTSRDVLDKQMGKGTKELSSAEMDRLRHLLDDNSPFVRALQTMLTRTEKTPDEVLRNVK